MNQKRCYSHMLRSKHHFWWMLAFCLLTYIFIYYLPRTPRDNWLITLAKPPFFAGRTIFNLVWLVVFVTFPFIFLFATYNPKVSSHTFTRCLWLLLIHFALTTMWTLAIIIAQSIFGGIVVHLLNIFVTCLALSVYYPVSKLSFLILVFHITWQTYILYIDIGLYAFNPFTPVF